MRALATAALLAGLCAAHLATRGTVPLPPRCAVRVQVVAPENRGEIVCAEAVPRTLAEFGAPVVPTVLRDGDRLEVTATGEVRRERMPGPALRLLRLPIDINRASMEDLEALPGIGPALAARLVAGRPYGAIGELSEVPGIGRKRLAALAPAVAVVESR